MSSSNGPSDFTTVTLTRGEDYHSDLRKVMKSPTHLQFSALSLRDIETLQPLGSFQIRGLSHPENVGTGAVHQFLARRKHIEVLQCLAFKFKLYILVTLKYWKAMAKACSAFLQVFR